jgi:hypothetical protein
LANVSQTLTTKNHTGIFVCDTLTSFPLPNVNELTSRFSKVVAPAGVVGGSVGVVGAVMARSAGANLARPAAVGRVDGLEMKSQ